MKVAHTFAEAREMTHGTVGLVPTMGYLHEGHLLHIERSADRNDTTVMSLFVNPLQFNDPSDLEKYPRDHERDAGLAAGAGADILFAPPVEEMYPRTPLTSVSVEKVTDHMEGALRPGHFEGVATVVAKLFAGLRPDLAYFGRKDAQQVAVITTMAADLSFPVTIVPGSTVRERDGLALSSRNVFLQSDDRAAALRLSQGLFAAADLIEAGSRDPSEIVAAVRGEVRGLRVDYIELADQRTAEPLETLDRPAFLALAAHVGATRLIDNVAIDVVDGSFVVDRGHRLDAPSMLYEEST